jgi:hypothetical protein
VLRIENCAQPIRISDSPFRKCGLAWPTRVRSLGSLFAPLWHRSEAKHEAVSALAQNG